MEALEIILSKLGGIEKQLGINKPVLNLEEVAILTGLSESTIYKYCFRKEIPHFKIGRLNYFDRKEIEDWMRQNRVKTVREIEEEAISNVQINSKGGDQ
jgi:excisionase family DNA binding protein